MSVYGKVVARESGPRFVLFGLRLYLGECAPTPRAFAIALLAVDDVPDETTVLSLPYTGIDTAALYILTASVPFLSFSQLQHGLSCQV